MAVNFDDTNELLNEVKEKINEQTVDLKPIDNRDELGKFDPNKSFIERLQRKTDKFVLTAREISSRGMSFIIAMLGVVLQASHTSLLMYDVSGFSSVILRVVVSLGLGIFISSALAVFTIKSDGKDRNILKIINIFFYFEVFTNLFYYFNSLIFSKVGKNFDFSNVDNRNWLYLVVAIPFAYVVPFAIKQFAGVISADEKLQFGSIEGPPEVLVDLTGEQLEALNANTKNIKTLSNQLEAVKFKTEGFDDFSQEVLNIKREYIKKGETFVIEADGKKTSMVIR